MNQIEDIFKILFALPYLRSNLNSYSAEVRPVLRLSCWEKETLTRVQILEDVRASFRCKTLGKRTESTCSPHSSRWIKQNVFFILNLATSLGEGKALNSNQL